MIISPLVKTGNDVTGIVPDGYEDDGKVFPFPARPLAEGVSASVRHVPVDQEDVGYVLCERAFRAGDRWEYGRVKALLFQIFFYDIRYVFIVLDIVDFCHLDASRVWRICVCAYNTPDLAPCQLKGGDKFMCPSFFDPCYNGLDR